LVLAANSKLIIIPFKIENVEPGPGLQYYLASTHWLDADEPADASADPPGLIDIVKKYSLA